MDVFEEHLAKVKKVQPQVLSEELFQAIKTASKYLIDLNKKQIKEDSQDIYGKAIGFYSKATDEISGGAKPWGTPFTGEDTGEWMDKFYMTVYQDVFYFGSTDPKTDDILSSPNWLSHDLFGLTDENLDKAIEEKFLPFVLEYCKKSLGL